MEQFTNYCTTKQLKRMIKLKAPLIKIEGKGMPYLIPTTQQAINWLEKEKKIFIDIDIIRDKGYRVAVDYHYINFNNYFSTRFDAEIAAIDNALNLLEELEGIYSIDDYEIIGWPEIQEYQDLEGFDENSTLIVVNYDMGIGKSTYLVSTSWLKSLQV